MQKIHFTRPLHVGMQGSDVLYVKDLLAELAREYKFYPSIFIPKVNRNYDVLTSSLVRKFQEYVGMKADGVFNKETWNAMETTYENYLTGQGLAVFGANGPRNAAVR